MTVAIIVAVPTFDDQHIRILREESAAAGDHATAYLCRVALHPEAAHARRWVFAILDRIVAAGTADDAAGAARLPRALPS